MSSTKKGLRRVAAVAVATLVVAPALATVASATSTFAFDRQAGANRYLTSVKVASTFGTSSSVILANGTNAHTVDALAAAYLAGVKHAPILLTTTDTTPPEVLAAITATGASTVYILGGTATVSNAQEAALDAKFGTVTRLGGLDRYLTAEKVIAEAGAAGAAKTAIVATGNQFPDALGAGPLSYVKGMPIGITTKSALPDSTLTALKGAGVTNAIVLGGPTVVGQSVLDALVAGGISLSTAAGVTAGRIFGSDRAETSTKLADFMITSHGFSNTAVNAASGDDAVKGADALGGAALSGKENVPTLITDSATTAGHGLLEFLTAHSATLASGHIFGGVGAVSAALATSMTNAAMTTATHPEPTTNQTYTVTPATAATIVGDANVTTPAVPNTNARTYTANVGTAATVSIALVDPADVTVGAGGAVTFAKLGSIATLTAATGIFVNQVNGATVSNGTTFSSVVPVAGVVTFRVNGNDTYVGSAIPVVFAATGGNLAVDTTGAPTKGFGIGGQVTVTPVAATAASGSVEVESVTGNSFVAGTPTSYAVYRFADTDTFVVNGITLTAAQFKADLVVGDFITASPYSTTGSRTFTIDVLIVGAPVIGTATKINLADNGGAVDRVKLTWTNPNNVGIQNPPAGYVVQKATVGTGGTVGTFTDETDTYAVTAPTGTAAANGAAFATFGLPAAGTTLVYRVYALGFGADVGDGQANSAVSNSVSTDAAQAAFSTLTPNSVAFTDSNADSKLGAGDTITVTMPGTMALSAVGATLTVTNNLGQVARITQGEGIATFTWSDQHLVIALLAEPTMVTSDAPFVVGDSGALRGYAVQVVSSTGITDAADATSTPNWVGADSRTSGDFIVRWLPGAPTTVSASHTTGQVTATINVVGDKARVYDASGTTLLGTSPASTGNQAVTFDVAGLTEGQHIYVVELGVVFGGTLESVPALTTTPVDEVQTVTLTGTVSSGTFTLTYNGQTTTGIPFDAGHGPVNDALVALSNIGSGNVAVLGAESPLTVIFTNGLGARDVAQMTASATGLRGSTPGVRIDTTTTGVPASSTVGATVS